jgi:hypothetical protein
MRILVALLIAALVGTSCASEGSSTVPDSIAGQATRPLELTRASSTPPVDRNLASVELDRIIFDTFGRGPSFNLADANDSAIADLFDAIPPIDAPSYQRPDDADWLDADDIVLGYTDPAGGTWAYPVRMLNAHELVNDELGGLPILITYCPLCGSGAVYERELDGRSLSFSNTSALFENDLVMVDRETGSYWWQVKGEAIVGSLTGQGLTLVPSVMSTWSDWVAASPETSVMSRIPGRSYGDAFGGYAASLDSGRTPFPVSEGVLDDPRLPASTNVLMVDIDGDVQAWPTLPKRTVGGVVGGSEVIITLDGEGGSIRTVDDEEIAARTMFWFAAVSAYPTIEVAG